MTKSRLMYWLSAALSLTALLAHETVGASMVLTPLHATNLPEKVIWMHHFSWHVGSVAVIAMIVMFIYAAMKPGSLPIALIATSMSTGFAILGIWLAVYGSSTLWDTPAPLAWGLIAITGGLGAGFEARQAKHTNENKA